MALDPTIIAGGMKLVAGLFGKKPKQMTPQQSIMSTAAGAREAAAAHGFNALTLLAGSNATAGAGMQMGGASPLASLSILGDFVEDNYSDRAKEEREFNRLQTELLSLQVDRARSLADVAPVSAVAGLGGTSPITGNMAVRRTASPGSEFLTEDLRNPALPAEQDVTVSMQSHGEETVVPVGPDIDEVMTGWFIDQVNKGKANKRRMAMGPMDRGTPLSIPRGVVNRSWELMPPSTAARSPRPRSRPKSNHLVPDDWWKFQAPN